MKVKYRCNMNVFKSKIDGWFGLILVYPIFVSIKNLLEGEWIGLIGLAVVVGLILIFSKTTRYIITENQLIIKSTWIVNEKIDISKITKIEKSNSVLSSPALSLDRIRIRYNKFDEVLISPKEKKEFINEVLKLIQILKFMFNGNQIFFLISLNLIKPASQLCLISFSETPFTICSCSFFVPANFVKKSLKKTVLSAVSAYALSNHFNSKHFTFSILVKSSPIHNTSLCIGSLAPKLEIGLKLKLKLLKKGEP